MILFPTLVVDDFLEDPDYVLCLATNAEYNDPDYTNYPGVASKKKIYELDQELFDTILQKIFGYYWDLRNPVNYNVEMEFQKIEKNGQGIIHLDTTYGALGAGVIYLNQNIERDTGTSFYKLKDDSYKISPRTLLEPISKYHAGEDVDGIENICQNHHDKFEETM